MKKSEIYKRLYKDYSKKFINKILLSVFFGVLVAVSTSAIAWLLDPAIKKIFVEKEQSLILTVFSFFQISNNKEKLLEFDQVQIEFDKMNIQFSKLAKKRREMQRALELGKLVNSNQARSYRSLAQVTRSVPQRVQFTKMTFDGKDSLIIEGVAFSDQDILNFISNLNAKSLIEQASLAAMKNKTGDQASGNNNKKGFTINCKLKSI